MNSAKAEAYICFGLDGQPKPDMSPELDIQTLLSNIYRNGYTHLNKKIAIHLINHTPELFFRHMSGPYCNTYPGSIFMCDGDQERENVALKKEMQHHWRKLLNALGQSYEYYAEIDLLLSNRGEIGFENDWPMEVINLTTREVIFDPVIHPTNFIYVSCKKLI